MGSLVQSIDLESIFTPQTIRSLISVSVQALIALLVLRLIVMIVKRVLKRRTTAQVTMLVTKAIGYLGVAVIVAVALLGLGVNLTPLLGAAGILGLAVGIASQASLSNMISGLFLVSEKPFAVGDVIRTGDTLGIVESIDLLSVKMRTFDNLFVRVPNEKLAGAQLTNITRYPIRRLDVHFVVPFETDIVRLFAILNEIARENAACLQEPAPFLVPDRFETEGVRIFFGVWFAKNDFLAVKTSIYQAIVARFRDEGIAFARPRRELSLDSAASSAPISFSLGGLPGESPPISPESGKP